MGNSGYIAASQKESRAANFNFNNRFGDLSARGITEDDVVHGRVAGKAAVSPKPQATNNSKAVSHRAMGM
jgi:hypothetical protein